MRTHGAVRPQVDVLLGRLQLLGGLSPGDSSRLEQELVRKIVDCRPGERIVGEEALSNDVHLMLSGWMLAYKSLEDGRRQITRVLLPGDTTGARSRHLADVGRAIICVTAGKYAVIDRERMADLMRGSAGMTRAFDCDEALSAGIQEQWLLSLGRRSALERLAHLLCEIIDRLELVGLVEDASCEFPLTQADLADATGLSVVHVNRVLQEMRYDGIISLRSRIVRIHKMDQLRDIAAYTPVRPRSPA